MNIDWSRGTAIHRLYGCFVLTMEARKQKKPESFIKFICKSVKCDGKPVHWSDQFLKEN